MIDEGKPFGASPQTAGTRHKCANCPAGDPDSYFVFPRSEINSLGKDWLNEIRRIVVNGGDIELAKHELDRRNGVATLYLLRLEPAAQVMSLRYSSEYDLEHRELERASQIDHSLAECPERLHPAPVRMWTPSAGWKELTVKPAGFAQ
ncbi:MAG: hypothetical protein HY233_05730 [Acidobacteriales bacterium]|nr:hypothetical protein [Terriglobales bacterium]